MKLRKELLRRRIVAVVCDNSCLIRPASAWAHARSLTYACQVKERMQVSESAKSFSLIQDPNLPFLLYQLGRFAGKALISLNGQVRMYYQREHF